MVSHTAEEIDELARRKLIKRVSEALVATQYLSNSHERAMAMLEQLAAGDPLEIIQVWRFRKQPPSASCRTSQPKDGEQGRSAIGGDLNTEGPTGRTTVTA
jgi:hypothetical protein